MASRNVKIDWLNGQLGNSCVALTEAGLRSNCTSTIRVAMGCTPATVHLCSLQAEAVSCDEVCDDQTHRFVTVEQIEFTSPRLMRQAIGGRVGVICFTARVRPSGLMTFQVDRESIAFHRAPPTDDAVDVLSTIRGRPITKAILTGV